MTALEQQVSEGTAESDKALDACVASANALLFKLVGDFRLSGIEIITVRAEVEDYTHAYRQYGIAQIMSDYFKASNLQFRAGLEDPIIEHSANIRKAALTFIKTLRDLGCDTQDINSISDALKQHGEAARLAGIAEGTLMLVKAKV